MHNGNHANTNIPKVIGAIRGYELTGDTRYESIAENFYRIVKDHLENYHQIETAFGQTVQDAD